MNPRSTALLESKRNLPIRQKSLRLNKKIPSSEEFGIHVFNQSVMQKMLSGDVYKNLIRAVEGKEKIKPEYAETIATAIKEWAINLGASHYCHWFQPLTGASAEKHDAFIDWIAPDKVVEKFSGKQLLQGEPDASSFPSGGLRNTYEARGYTGWDPTSPPFVWKGGDGVTLCIPSVFFSWTGTVLDAKIPLLRSDHKLNAAACRLLRLTGLSGTHVYSTLGLEQEYFVIDRSLRNLRQDLVLLGKTVFGAPSAKGQELQDHYFGSVKDRVLSFMRDFEIAAFHLGIPVKTRHNEVAPAQHEVAPVFEKASKAVDHNLLLMELMRHIASKHHLSCLLHEKPFFGLNGSGKHANWSMCTDTGLNLLDPTDTPGNSLHFLILLTAILNAVHQHAPLLRASISSASNDDRLGGHEAPPAIISVYLGEELESILKHIEEKGLHNKKTDAIKFDLKVPVIPELPKDNTDRNRTSPFAFTGNKFEFRAVGSSSNPALPVTVINAIVAESLNKILDEIESKLTHSPLPPSANDLAKAAIPVVQKYLKQSKAIRFSGDNYSPEWTKEAVKRKLPNLKKSPEAFDAFLFPHTIAAFEGILTKEELLSRFEIFNEIYCHNLHIQAQLMLKITREEILPTVFKQQKNLAKSLDLFQKVAGKSASKKQKQLLENYHQWIEEAIEKTHSLEKITEKALKAPLEEKSSLFANQVQESCAKLRAIIDTLEEHTDNSLWPLPKYWELLFIV